MKWSTQPLQPLSELHLKHTYATIPTSAQTKHQPAFIWCRGRWAGGRGVLSFPYPTGFLTATVNTGPLKGHTVCHPWAPVRSSPLININDHCTKWSHWLLTRGVEDGNGGSSTAGAMGKQRPNLKKSGRCLWHMDLLSLKRTQCIRIPHDFDCLVLTLDSGVRSATAGSFNSDHIGHPLE